MMDQQLSEIEARVSAAAPGPWWWDHCYECYPLCAIDEDDCGPELVSCQGRHYALVNEESQKQRRVIDYRLVLLTAQEEDLEGRNIADLPNHQFIANARTDVPALIAEVRRLRAALAEIAELPHMASVAIEKAREVLAK